ncbi:MAG TPA: hypothetical protein VMP01_29175 [Pirellulaceae bacterium]|nr:hypothetical protein [Pirellulaceae bacterium]
MRFTIRDLLWLTVVVALGVAWWLDRSKVADDRQELQSSERELRRITGTQQKVIEDYGRALMAVPEDVFSRSRQLRNPSAAGSSQPKDKNMKDEEWLPPPGTVREGFQLDAF